MQASSPEVCFISSMVNPPLAKLENGQRHEVLAETSLTVSGGLAPLQEVQRNGVAAALGVVWEDQAVGT